MSYYAIQSAPSVLTKVEHDPKGEEVSDAQHSPSAADLEKNFSSGTGT